MPRRSGATLLTPPLPWAEAMLRVCGQCVAVEDESKFRRLLCMTCLMGDFYKRQLSAQEWLKSHGINEALFKHGFKALIKKYKQKYKQNEE